MPDAFTELFAQPVFAAAFNTLWLVLAALASYYLGRRILLRFLRALFQRTRNTFDNHLLSAHTIEHTIKLLPAVVIYSGAPMFGELAPVIRKCVHIYCLFVGALVFNSLLTAALFAYEETSLARRRPLKGYVQLGHIFVFCVCGVLAVSLAIDTSPWGVLSGLGALTAVLMLLFKDTILSFVAGIHIAGNDLLRPGDWIEMPAFGADGDVEDIALHTVKVRNFDKTVVAIPTNKFLDHSFRNWRGMQEAGGRRIKRSLLIDQSSVRFLGPDDLARLERIDLLREHLLQRQQEIEAYNLEIAATTAPASREQQFDEDIPLNGRRQTNLGAFRAYAEAYIKANPMIRKDLTCMVRHLRPQADEGLPMEIYCFTATTDWVRYEAVQADLFDHLLAALPQFGLRAYQRNALTDARVRPPAPEGE